MKKPHKGIITNWRKYYLASKDGFLISGRCANHPQFGTNPFFHTSHVLKHNKKTGEIETLNSKYILDPPHDHDEKSTDKPYIWRA